MNVTTQRLTQFLDTTLKTDAIRDISNNGLQIANNGTVTHIALGVDASLRFLKEAAGQGADFVICHHGISWGDSLRRVTGLNHAIISYAIRHNIALYASHLPLDMHPQHGNNAQLCKALRLRNVTPAFTYHGETIGFTGTLPKPIPLTTLCATVTAIVVRDINPAAFGPATVKTIGIVSGGGADMISEAAERGIDVFLTGESSLQGYITAENLNLNVIFAGHYATEVFGIRALAKLITQKFRTPTTLIDFAIPH